MATSFEPLPTDPHELHALVLGLTRHELIARHGPPHEFEPDATGSWHGPSMVYRGEFAWADGSKATRVHIYFRQAATGASVAASVTFNS